MDTFKQPSKISSLLTRGLIILAIIAAIYFGWQWLNPLAALNAIQPTASPSSGLTLNIEDGATFSEPILNLSGTAFPDRQLLINGQPLPINPDGRFNLTLQLAEGPNLIIVETFDEKGNIISLVRQVTYSPPGAAPSVPPPSASTSSGLLGFALLVILAAAGLAIMRRRKPWIHVTTDTPQFKPSSLTGIPHPLTIIVELDRTTRLSLHVTDENRSRLTTLLNNRRREAGRHTFTWNGYSLSGDVAQPGKVFIVGEAGIPPAKVRAKAEVTILYNHETHSV